MNLGTNMMKVPSNMILNKFGKPSIYLPGCMLAWGILSTCTAATKSYGGLLACRFILGFVEAAYFVRIVFIWELHLLIYTAWLPLPAFSMVHAQRTSETNGISLLGLLNFWCLLGAYCRWHYQWFEWCTRNLCVEMVVHYRGSYHSGNYIESFELHDADISLDFCCFDFHLHYTGSATYDILADRR